MCGIAGVVLRDPKARVDGNLLGAMAQSLAHRGPDDQTVHTEGCFGLAFRRLAIIDPTGGAQPLFNEERDVVAVMNGEIYNFRELRRGLEERGHRFRTGSDAEVLVHLYEEQGDDLVDHLEGMYALAIADLRSGPGRLLLARDRIGIKPLYWTLGPRGLAFASEPKALLVTGWTPRELEPCALLDYLVAGYLAGERSAWSGIRRLGPAEVLSFTPGEEGASPIIRRTWDLPLEAPVQPAEPGEIRSQLDRAVGQRLVSDVPLGAFLSGGIDSSAVATSMQSRADPLVLCSVGFEERSHDELNQAKRTARALGAVHHCSVLRPDPVQVLERLPWFFDEPLADPSTVPTHLVSAMAREHVTVALSGDGGDEVFAGYRRYVHDVAEQRVRGAIGPLGQRLAAGLGAVYPKLDWAPRVFRGRTFLRNLALDPARAYWGSVTQMSRAEALAVLHPDVVARLGDHDPFHAFEAHYRRPTHGDALYRAQYADLHTQLPEGILCKVDRASMAASLEVRVPLLDHRLVERFVAMPTEHKVVGGRGKHALREALRGRVEDSVLDGTKRGFGTPLRAWLAGPLAASVADAIETLPQDWFRRDVLRRRLTAHRLGTRDHGRLLWSVLVLEHWRRAHNVRGLVA